MLIPYTPSRVSSLHAVMANAPAVAGGSSGACHPSCQYIRANPVARPLPPTSNRGLSTNKHFSSTLSVHKQPNPRKQLQNLDLTSSYSRMSRELPLWHGLASAHPEHYTAQR
jgi:hypothetical protein